MKTTLNPFVWRIITAGSSICRKVDWNTSFLESTRSGFPKSHGQWIQSISLSCYPDFIEVSLDLPRLTSLSFTNPENESLIADCIKKAPPSFTRVIMRVDWKTLGICGFEDFPDYGGASKDFLLEHALKLEEVRLDMMPRMSSKATRQSLCSTPTSKNCSMVRLQRGSRR